MSQLEGWETKYPCKSTMQVDDGKFLVSPGIALADVCEHAERQPGRNEAPAVAQVRRPGAPTTTLFPWECSQEPLIAVLPPDRGRDA